MFGHINVIFSRLTKLETEIQYLTEKFKTEQDNIQIDAPDSDLDIDGQGTQLAHHTIVVVSVHELLTSPDPESVDASNTQDEIADRDWLNTSHPTPEDSHRPHNLPQQVPDHPSVDTSTEPQHEKYNIQK